MKSLLREHKRTLIFSSIITLLPLFAGLCLWNILPDVLVAHWNIHGEPDGYMSKAALIFGLPLFMLAMAGLCKGSAVYCDVGGKTGNHPGDDFILGTDSRIWMGVGNQRTQVTS